MLLLAFVSNSRHALFFQKRLLFFQKTAVVFPETRAVSKVNVWVYVKNKRLCQRKVAILLIEELFE